MEAFKKLSQVLTEEEFSNFMSNVLKYAGKDYLVNSISKTNTPYSLVKLSFVWDGTDEGFEYWEEIGNRLLNI